MISFNEPYFSQKGMEYIDDAICRNKQLNGDGPFTHKCSKWMEERFRIPHVLLTTSCTHALEMAAILGELKEGDEVIMPSFNFVSAADACVLRGARIKFVDIRKDTMNIDERLVENAITPKTKMIVAVQYAGVAAEMDTLLDIAHKHKILLVEDAAQGVMSTYKGRYLGAIGDLGTYSFHETKNYTMGEGGALTINDSGMIERAEIIREKGTNRKQYFRGEVDKYSWVDIGSSYLPSEMNAAYLFGQLEEADAILDGRMKLWNRYFELLTPLEKKEKIELPYVPKECTHNAHMFYIKVKDLSERTKLLAYLFQNGVHAVFHYVPLHLSKAGKKYGDFIGSDINTIRESDRLIRLPLHSAMTKEDVDKVVELVNQFYLEEIHGI